MKAQRQLPSACRSFPLLVAGLLACAPSARCAEFDFIPDSGTWSDPNAWVTGVGMHDVPTAGDDAVFGAIAGGANKTYTVTANGNSIHNIVLDTNATALTINLAGNLTASGLLTGRSVTLTGSSMLSADSISVGQFTIGSGVMVQANSSFQSGFTLVMSGGSSLTTNGEFSGNQVLVSGGSSIKSASATINGNFGDSTLAGASTWTVGGAFVSNNTYTLTISGGSTLSCLTAQMSGSASVTVDGGGSSWKIGGDATIQSTGGGMDAERGGAVSVGGNLTINNTGAVFANDSDTTGASRIDVTGKVDVDSGGAISIGQNATFTSAGVTTRASAPSGGSLVYGSYLTVNGTWNNTGGFIVGQSGQNTSGYADDLNVASGGTLTTSGNLVVGQGAAFNTFEVDSGGTVLNVNGTLAQNAGSHTDASVQGGSWTNSGTLTVGDGGTATLRIGDFLDPSLPPVSGTVKSADATVGNQAGSSGSVIVAGAGLWTVNGKLTAGAAGMSQGSVYVGPGGQLKVTGSTITLGRDAGSVGSLTLDNFQAQGTQFTFTGSLQVGLAGTGTLAVLNGFQLDQTGQSLTLGGQATANGTLRVSDDYAQYGLPATTQTLYKSDALTVGSLGTGTLTIANNGLVLTGGNAVVGEMGGGVGTATITGAGSKWQVTGNLTVGAAGLSQGSVTVDHGGQLAVTGPTIILGRDANSEGTLTLSNTSGLGSQFQFAGDLQVGAAGNGTLEVLNGFQFDQGAKSLVLGGQATSTGTLRVSNDDTQSSSPSTQQALYKSTNLTVGSLGTGVLKIENNGAVETTGNAVVGEMAGSKGTATITGQGSTWSVNGNLVVGQYGGADPAGVGASVKVADSGTLLVSGTSFVLGQESGSRGTLIVDGVGSTVTGTAATNLEIGRHGIGTLQLQNGASLTIASTTLGSQGDGAGRLTVDGNGTTLSINGSLTVGGVSPGVAPSAADPGSNGGELTVSNGADVAVGLGQAGDFVVGRDAGSTGLVQLTGAGSHLLLNDSANITVGQNGTGTLNVAGGAYFGNANAPISDLYIGRNTGSNGTVRITGSGGTNDSRFYATDLLSVGTNGQGTLILENGGKLDSADVSVLAGSQTGTGKITVTGAGSLLHAGSLKLGGDSSGTGQLMVLNGGRVQADTQINVDTGSTTFNDSLIHVDGASSTLTTKTLLLGPSYGAPVLQVTGGGSVVVTDSGGSDIGLFTPTAFHSITTIQVDGVGSQLTVAGSNANLASPMEVTGGGSATFNSLTLSSSPGYARLTVGGDAATPSSVGVTTDFNLGQGFSDSGTLDVRAGGSVRVGGNLNVAGQSTVLIANGAQLRASAISLTNGGTMTTFAGGRVTADSSLSIDRVSSVTNGGSINIGATTGQAPDGTTLVGFGGRLKVNGTISGTVVAQFGGSVGGAGTINGNVVNGGLFAPGDPQTLTVNGNYEQQNNGRLQIAIAGLNPAAMDHLNVSGTLSLDGGTMLELDFIDGYAPKAGDAFDFLTFGSLDPANSSFGSVDIEGLQPGFEYTVAPDGTNGYELTALNDGVSAVPEPSTVAMLVAGAGGLLLVSRRRLRQMAARA